MEAIHERTFGEDDRKGTITFQYDIDNTWGLRESNHVHSNAEFTAKFEVQPLDQPAPNRPFRQWYFWPFSNWTTDPLTWPEYEATFRDVAEVDKRHQPHPTADALARDRLLRDRLPIAGEQRQLLRHVPGGNLRSAAPSVFNEPVFSSNSYRSDGNSLDTNRPEDAEAIREINVKHGYQVGSDTVTWFLGKWTAGRVHDPVRAFRESRDAFMRGDWPILSISDEGKFSSKGHAVLPYAWTAHGGGH